MKKSTNADEQWSSLRQSVVGLGLVSVALLMSSPVGVADAATSVERRYEFYPPTVEHVNIHRYDGLDWPVLTLGGKTRGNTAIRAIYNEPTKTDVFQVAIGGDRGADIAPFRMQTWNHIEVEMTGSGFSVSVNQSPAQSVPQPLLRKICFGGLYATPEWPMGKQSVSDIRLKLDSIIVQ